MASTSSFKDKVKPNEWDIMGKITLLTLDLSNKNLNKLPDELFELKDLEALDLSRNKDIDLPNELIKLTNLKLLSLDRCHIDTVPTVVLKLPQLQTLILGNNENINLPDKMSSLVNLTVLHLDHCKLNTLTPVVLKLLNLQNLNLSGNKLTSLPYEFCGLQNIKVLDLSYCKLDTVPPAVLKLTQLEELALNGNWGIHLPDELSGLTNIRVLKLDINRLMGKNLATGPPVVWRLTQLERLDLRMSSSERHIIQIDLGPYDPISLGPYDPISLPAEVGRLTNIKHFDLSHCELRTLPPEVWRLTQLEWLNLGSNPLQTLPAKVGRLTNIKHLDLSHCELRARTLPPEVWRLTQLEWLNLGSNPLQTVPAEVGQLTNIKHLDLSHCELRTLPPEVGRLTQLEWLNLSRNSLQTLPGEVGQLINVKHLDLSECQLRTLPPEVGRLTQLELLNLSWNPLLTLPVEVGQLINVKHLDLSHCQLRTLPPEVGRLTQLDELDLDRNPLQTLPAEVGQLTNVKHLRLSYCKLRTLPPEVGKLAQLQKLYLRDNQLQMLPTEVGQLKYLVYLDARKNPLIKPPSEVCRQGISAIRQYFDELERSEENVSARLKVVVLGEKMAGKTSLVQTLRIGKSTLTRYEDRTHCVEITQWAPDNNITFEVYDFGGHDVYHLTHQFFLTPDAFYLLLVNLETYSEKRYTEAVGFWLDTLNARVPGAVVSLVGSKKDLCRPDDVTIKTNDIQRRIKVHMKNWERQLEEHNARLTSKQAFQQEGYSNSTEGIAKQLAHTDCLLRQGLRIVGDVLCVSVKPKSLIRGIFSKSPSWVSLKNHLLETANNKALFPTLQRVLPKTWVLFQQFLKVSMETSEQAEKTDSSDETVESQTHGESFSHGKTNQPERYWLTLAEFKRIERLAELSSDKLEPVLSYLQQVGTILRYTDIPELKELVFHDPPALTELFKDLFHHDTKALFSTPRFAEFTFSQINKIESDLSDRCLIQKEVMTHLLPPGINPDIVTALMQNFGLCFEIQDKTDPSKHTCLYRIPWYLQNQMPEELKRVWPEDVPEEQEQLQLMCDIRGFCPRGLFQRFSVGIHPLVKDRVDWKDGVMAYKQDYPVPVCMCSNTVADDTYITIATRGSLAKAGEMWGVVHPLLEVLVQLLQEWPGVLYSLHVTCAHCIKARLDNPHQYDLSDRTADDGRDVRCPRVLHTASTSANLVYRPDGIRGMKQHLMAFEVSLTVNTEVSGSPGGDFNRLRRLLTEVKVKDDTYGDHYTRLAAHVSELGLTFRAAVPGDGNCMFHAVSDQVLRTEGKHMDHLQLRQQAVDHLRRNPRNAHGDHLSNYIPNQAWEEYLETMSRDGTWGDHVVLQAMADMLGRDVIIVSSVEADNYVTVLHPQSQASPRSSLLLGHYAENHYESLDETPSGSKPVVLLVIDEVGTSKGGISTINGQLLDLLTSAKAKVLCTVLHATEEEKRKARSKGIDLVLPMANITGESRSTLDWLTYHHKTHYPILRSDISVIVGHADVTSTAARNIKKERLPSAKFILYNHVMPEDTEHHKSDDKAIGIGDKTEAIDKDIQDADVVFSVGPTMFDYYKNEIRGLNKTHHQFLPKPSNVFSNMTVKYEETETKVVLSVGRVKGVEKLKGYDLVAKAMVKVLKKFQKGWWRIRGISFEEYEESKKIIQSNVDFTFTPLPYGTQEQLKNDFRKAHVVLMPSRAEPFGLVGLEAIAAGVPVLVSSNSGLAEFLEKQDPEFHRRIVDIDGADDVVADRLADRIIEVLGGGREEFEAAKRLKDNLLASKYWEESHRKFLEECGIPQ
ncbi:uncharacterized protein LOC144884161 [Branchiostoma floridae x Branchiostoma japonicum]